VSAVPRWLDGGGPMDGGLYADGELVHARPKAVGGSATMGFAVAQCPSAGTAQALARMCHLHEPLVELARAGAAMRDAQRRHFKTRDRADLVASKEAEAAFDRLVREMDAVEAISPQARCFP